MSAFVVSPEHIDALLTAAAAWSEGYLIQWSKPELGREDFDGVSEITGQLWRRFEYAHADKIGQMLVDENYRSVNYRYSHHGEPSEPYQYEFRKLPGKPDPRIVLQAIACYQYQACECPDWEKTEAFAFTEQLKGHAISHLLSGAPGWGIDDRNIFTRSSEPSVA